MSNEIIYRCNKECPINKKCFIIKLTQPLKEKVSVLHKCQAFKKDITIEIGGTRPP